MGGRAAMKPVEYVAAAEVHIAVSNAQMSAEELVELDSYVRSQTPYYAGLVTAPRVTAAVSQRLGGVLGSDEVAERLSASATEETSSITLKATGDDPALTVELANAGAQTLQEVVDLDFTPPTGQEPAVTAQITRPAEPPATPLSRAIKKNTIVGFVAGMALGVIAMTLRESLRSRFRGRRDLEVAIDGPVLAAIPRVTPDGNLLGLEAAEEGTDLEAVRAYQQLRANVQFVGDEKGRIISVTPVGTSSEAAVIAANLAGVLARAEFSVCLVDAVFEKSKVDQIFGVTRTEGLGGLLQKTSDLDAVIQYQPKTQMAVLPAGTIPLNPEDLLSSRVMADALGRLETVFDYVVVSTESLPQSVGATVLAKRADGALLVVDSQVSTRAELFSAIDRLDEIKAEFLGTVWVGGQAN